MCEEGIKNTNRRRLFIFDLQCASHTGNMLRSGEYYYVQLKYLKDCLVLRIILEKDGRIFVIAPSEPVTVKRVEGDMDKLGNLYWLGYNDAKRNLFALTKYLK